MNIHRHSISPGVVAGLSIAMIAIALWLGLLPANRSSPRSGYRQSAAKLPPGKIGPLRIPLRVELSWFIEDDPVNRVDRVSRSLAADPRTADMEIQTADLFARADADVRGLPDVLQPAPAA